MRRIGRTIEQSHLALDTQPLLGTVSTLAVEAGVAGASLLRPDGHDELIEAILAAGVLGNLAAHQVTAPPRTVSDRIRAFARGDTMTVAHRSEIGEIAALEDAFDAVRTELATLKASRERAQQERDQHAEEASKRAALLDLAHDAIIERSLDTSTIRYWNAGAERLYGYSREVALGQTSHALLHTIYPMDEATIYEIVRRTGFWEGELTHTTADGTTIDVESRWALKRASRGDPEAILEVNRDITARKAAQDALARSNADLQQFGYTVSHDLKAPLVSIQGFADRLNREYETSLDARALHMLSRIGTNAGRLCTLIDEVMLYSRFGRVEAPLAPVDLAEAIKRATEALRHQIEQSGASIVLVTPLPVIMTVPTFLDQILTNLVANALTYGSRIDEPPRVEVGCVALSGSWRLFVRDNGPGIPPDQIQRLFRLFERLPDSKARNPNGNGAGLSIVRRAIEAMGGRVGVESPAGDGATFWVEFPRDPSVRHDGPALIAGDSLNRRQNGVETKN